MVKDSDPQDQINLAVVIQTSNIPSNNIYTFPQLPEIFRINDPYFLDTAKAVLIPNIKYCQTKALFLQQKYYAYMQECLKPDQNGHVKSKRQF